MFKPEDFDAYCYAQGHLTREQAAEAVNDWLREMPVVFKHDTWVGPGRIVECWSNFKCEKPVRKARLIPIEKTDERSES